jgi:hypothetical protein
VNMRIEIAGNQAIFKQDGREVISVAVSDLLKKIVDGSDALVLPEAIPEGLRFVQRRGDTVALVLEEKPQVRTVRWLADDSPSPYGRGAVYRTARLAFPFVIIVVGVRGGQLTGFQQCFYRTAPLARLTDELYYPNLYNVADGYGQECWLCLANLKKNLTALSWDEKVKEIRKHLWGAGFNQSSEHHEGMSYWQVMRELALDTRLASVEAWEKATRKEPLFPLEVKWLTTGKTLGKVVDEFFSSMGVGQLPATVEDLVQVMNQCPPAASKQPTGFEVKL